MFRWTPILSKNLPSIRSYFQFLPFGNSFLLLGGGIYAPPNASLPVPAEVSDSWYTLDFAGNSFTNVNTIKSCNNSILYTPRSSGACTVPSTGTLICYGGMNNQSSPPYFPNSTTYTYYTTYNGVSTCFLSTTPTINPGPRDAHTMVSVNGLIYLFGGRMDELYTPAPSGLWSYSPSTKLWSSITESMNNGPVARWGHSSVAVGNLIFIFG